MTELKRDDPVVFHYRVKNGETILPRSGATVVFLPKYKRFGVALCCDKDMYCREWGRKIAANRAADGEKIRIQPKRFKTSVYYDGPVTIENVREMANFLIEESAPRVGNKTWVDNKNPCCSGGGCGCKNSA